LLCFCRSEPCHLGKVRESKGAIQVIRARLRKLAKSPGWGVTGVEKWPGEGKKKPVSNV